MFLIQRRRAAREYLIGIAAHRMTSMPFRLMTLRSAGAGPLGTFYATLELREIAGRNIQIARENAPAEFRPFAHRADLRTSDRQHLRHGTKVAQCDFLVGSPVHDPHVTHILCRRQQLPGQAANLLLCHRAPP